MVTKESNSKEIVFAILQDEKFMLGRKDIKLSKIIIESNSLDGYEDITIEKAKRVRRISFNMYLIEDEEHIYYVISSKRSYKFDSHISISDNIPIIDEEYKIRRFMYNYGACCYEQEIKTTPVRKIKRIKDNLYKIKTSNSTYYTLVNEKTHD